MLSASISTANFLSDSSMSGLFYFRKIRIFLDSGRRSIFFRSGPPAPGSALPASAVPFLQYGARQRVCLDVRRALPPGQFPGRDGRAPRSELLRCGLLAAAAAGHCPHCMILPALHDKGASRRARSSCLLPPLFRGLSAPVRARYRIEFILMLALTSAIALMRLIATSLSAWCGFWLTSFTYPSRSDF